MRDIREGEMGGEVPEADGVSEPEGDGNSGEHFDLRETQRDEGVFEKTQDLFIQNNLVHILEDSTPIARVKRARR